MEDVKDYNVVVNYLAVILQQHIPRAIGTEHWNQKIKGDRLGRHPRMFALRLDSHQPAEVLCVFFGVNRLVASVPWCN